IKNMSAKDPQRYAFAAQDVDGITRTLARFENNLKFSEEDKGRLATDFEIRARDLATRLQVEAQQKKDVESAKTAAEAYRKYLSLFDKSTERKTIMQNRADALYQAKMYLPSGMQYEEVAKDLQDSPERRDVMYSAIQSYFESIDEDSQFRDKNPTSDGLLDKLQLVRAREGLKQLGAYYVKVWPKTDKTAQVKFNIARMYYQQGDYDRSVELFTLYVKEYPTSKEAVIAGNLAVDSLAKSDDYEGMAKLATEFANNATIPDAKFKNEMARLAESARKRKVEFTVLASSEGDFSATMLAEWEKNKGTAEGEEFLYTAFVKYKQEGNIAGVNDFGGRLIGAYPQSPKLVDVVATMGNFAVRSADFERAAFMFEEFNKRFPKEKNANEVLLSAANIRMLLGEYEDAAKDYRSLRGTGASDAQTESHRKLMQIYRDAQDWEQLARVAQTAAQETKNWFLPTFNLGLAYARQGKDQLAEKELAAAVRQPTKGDEESALVAQAYFELGQIQQKRFETIQFKGTANQEQILGEKLKGLQQIEGLYSQAIGTGQGEWVLGAAQGLARLYQEFGNFIANAPAPDGMGAADAKQYQAALAQQAAPYTAKANETLSACAQKANELKLMSPFATACLSGKTTSSSAGSAKRVRTAVTGDDAYQKELAAYRAELVNKPSSVEVIEKIGRRAMQVGDYRLAKLTLTKAVEIDPRNVRVQNLLGVASWQLGETQEAYEAFQRAYKARSNEAAANLAALYREYGYTKDAQAMLGRAGDLNSANLSAADYHPSVRALLSEGAGS
ncbi:MAG: tetratricopeptide repeat protein, partial [Clostridia bacterium]|nr:tetratricopeptide repeat protein [Deltaproteobacteria bacterium]